MLNRYQQFGQKGEAAALKFLKKQKFKILEKNYRTRQGEIDIIAKDGDTLTFIEVKARTSDLFGTPKYAVTFQKQRKISMVALHYLKATNQSDVRARFDVVTVSSVGDSHKIEIIKNAFELAYT